MYLTRRRNPNSPRPVVVHVGQLVREPLDYVRGEVGLVVNNDAVGRGHGAVSYLLGDDVEIIPIPSSDAKVHDRPRRRVLEGSRPGHGVDPSVYPLLNDDEEEAGLVRLPVNPHRGQSRFKLGDLRGKAFLG